MNDGYNPQSNYNMASGYPLPEYPHIQQTQFPPNLHQGYGHAAVSQVPQSYALEAAYPTPQQRPDSDYNSTVQRPTYSHPRPTHNGVYPSYDRQDNRAIDRGRGKPNNQPVLMGPPIRLGFDRDTSGGQRPSPVLIQSYPQPVDDRARPYIPESQGGNRQPYRHTSPGNPRSSRRDTTHSFQGQRSRGQKRGHSDAFGETKKSISKSQVAPAVPSFGIPLPTKPPIPQENGKKRKKKRRHNQLGLTPRTEEHESSEEEDDVDEESKLAAAVVGPSTEQQQLKFTYKGQTATLKSSAEIAAFIEERKKRFPTKGRREEAAKLKQEKQVAQRAADQVRRKALENQKAEFRAKQSLEAKEAKEKEKEKKQAEKDQAETESNRAVSKAKSKVEKLRRQLEKEEKRIAKAEAKASKVKSNIYKDDQSLEEHEANTATEPANNDVIIGSTYFNEASQVNVELVAPVKHKEASLLKNENISSVKSEIDEIPKTATTLGLMQEETGEMQNTVPDPLTPTSQPSLPDRQMVQQSIDSPKVLDVADLGPISLENGSISEAEDKAEDSISTTSSDDSDLSISTDSDSEDLTSSSGSSSDSDAPETASSTRTAPDKVPPPKKSKQKAICRNFLKSGRCARGDNCSFRHELPERGSQGTKNRNEGKKAELRTGRKGLYQRVC